MKLLALALIVSIGATGAAWSAVSASKLSETEALVFAKVEAERERMNPAVRHFTLDPDLARVAHDRSADMAARGAFEHSNAAGENPYVIVAKSIAHFRGAVGENIMTDAVPSTGFDPAGAATRVVAAWIASPQHAGNIASPMFDKVGVGAAEKDGIVYVTLIFTGPMPSGSVPAH